MTLFEQIFGFFTILVCEYLYSMYTVFCMYYIFNV